MTPSQGQLADYMSELSEQAFCAGWMDGLEVALWEAVLGLRTEYGYLTITDSHRDALRALSDKCGGWILYRDQTGQTWVPLDEWKAHFSAGRPPFVSRVDDQLP